MKIIFSSLLVAAIVAGLTACGGGKQGACRIHGVVSDAQMEGKTMFLVPFTNDSPDNVDSAKIVNGSFEFTTDTGMLAKLIMDYHYRLGTQTLLVVTEPGTVNVTFGAVSSGGGTPLNDSLQGWKTVTERHNSEYGPLIKQYREADNKGDKSQAALLKAKADSVHLAYKQYSRRLADNVKNTVLSDFLQDMFPRKYKLAKPDSTVVWVDADTQEELGPVEE